MYLHARLHLGFTVHGRGGPDVEEATFVTYYGNTSPQLIHFFHGHLPAKLSYLPHVQGNVYLQVYQTLAKEVEEVSGYSRSFP